MPSQQLIRHTQVAAVYMLNCSARDHKWNPTVAQWAGQSDRTAEPISTLLFTFLNGDDGYTACRWTHNPSQLTWSEGHQPHHALITQTAQTLVMVITMITTLYTAKQVKPTKPLALQSVCRVILTYLLKPRDGITKLHMHYYYSARSTALPSIENTLWRVWTVFTRSPITPPEVNRFGWNLGRFEYVVCRWPWQILGKIRAEARAGERAEILFFFVR